MEFNWAILVMLHERSFVLFRQPLIQMLIHANIKET